MADYSELEVTGAARAAVLARVYAQIEAFGLTMPEVEPLVLHFGLDRFAEVGETEFWIANEADLGYCGKFLFVLDGQTCPYHRHRVKHETFFVVRGAIRMTVGEEERTMGEGDRLVMPPGVGHSFTGVGPALILEVSMPSTRQDNFFADPAIGEGGVI
jgi:mannose-6-phosphate isomerase-like protein (cupin superfamily)